MCALVSIDFLKAVYQTTNIMPKEVFESFKTGEVYNFGLISVREIDFSQLKFFDEILLGVLSGSFIQCMIAIIVSTFIYNEYKSGYFEIAISHGQSRIQMFLQYAACSILSIIPLLLVSIIGVNISLLYNGMFVFENVSMIIETIILQFIMLCALCICIASSSLLIHGYKSIVINVSAILFLPLLPNYISVFTKGKVNIDSFLLLNRLINSGADHNNNIINLILLSIITAILFLLPCIGYFKNRNFN